LKHTTILRPFFWDHPGELVPKENVWTLWCKGRLTEADTPTIRLGATPSRLTSAYLHHPAIFFPAAQPTVSKHWSQLPHSSPYLKCINLTVLVIFAVFLHCFNAVGWVAGRASGL